MDITSMITLCWAYTKDVMRVALTWSHKTLKSRELPGPGPRTERQRIKWGRSDPQPLVWRQRRPRDKSMACKDGGSSLNNQKGNGDLNSTTARNWILPTRREPEAYLSLGILWTSASRHREQRTSPCCVDADLQNRGLIHGGCCKQLYLW